MKRSRLLRPSFAPLVFIGFVFSAAVTFAAEPSPADNAKQIVLLPPRGDEAANQDILQWQKRIKENPTASAYWERLGWAYIRKARATQDPGFYRLAELTADAWEFSCGTSSDARLLRGHVDHNLHRFKEAEIIARRLVEERKAPADYALLCDALMEQGELNAAVEVCQTLTNLRPGVESFSRIAHLRWLFGDLAGALDAMKAAIRAVDPRDNETRAWLYTRFAHYELLSGHALEAVGLSETALSAVSEYPLALAIKGRALYSVGQYEAGLTFLRRAAERNPIPDNQWWLADALRARGEVIPAEEVEAKLFRQGRAIDPRTLALFLATRGEKIDWAVGLASEELKNRSDIFTHDALAFALFRSGKRAEAAAEIALATAHQTEDPRLWLHAGLLAEEAGDRASAKRYLDRAKAMAAVLTPSEQALLASHLSPALVAAAR